MILSIKEIVDAIIITAALGFIFMDIFQKTNPDKGRYYVAKGFDIESFKFAALVTAPAIILHELGHKFAAISFGLEATFHAAYSWLGIGIILKLIGSPFLFFVPAFVSFPSTALPWQSAIIAFAGPAVNGLLWLGSDIVIRQKKLKKNQMYFAYMFRYINGFLFIFNLIPIPPFDGGHVVSGLFGTFF